MEYDESKVYTAVTADKLKIGSKVVIAKNIHGLKDLVHNNMTVKLTDVYSEDCQDRFHGEFDKKIEGVVNTVTGTLAYLVSEPEGKKLKWTDLKIGDTIKKDTISLVVMGIDTGDTSCHIFAGRSWMYDVDLEGWEKVELW